MSQPREVFLSFAAADRATADPLRSCLARHGVNVWFAPHDVATAAVWQDEIGQALRRCDWFLVLVTPVSVTRMWVRREVSYALSRPHLEGRIAAIVQAGADPDDLSWVLTLAQNEALDDRVCERLLRRWGIPWQPPDHA